MPKVELVGEKTSLAERRASSGTQEEKRFYDLWKKEPATRGLHVVRLCGYKIRRAQAQIEFNLAMAVKDNLKSFYKCIKNKRRANENLHPLLNGEGGSGGGKTADEQKGSNSICSLCQSLLVRLILLRVLILLSWKTETGSRIKPL